MTRRGFFGALAGLAAAARSPSSAVAAAPIKFLRSDGTWSVPVESAFAAVTRALDEATARVSRPLKYEIAPTANFPGVFAFAQRQADRRNVVIYPGATDIAIHTTGPVDEILL